MKQWMAQGRRAAGELLALSGKLGGSPGEMTDRLWAFAEAEALVAPFIDAAPQRLRGLRSEIEAELEGTGLSIEQVVGDRESEAAREVRNLYRIARRIAREPAAKQVVIDLSALKASRALEAQFPDLAVELTAHLQEFGWVRTVSTGLDILSPKEQLQRIQMALLRWNAETIALAAAPPESDGFESPGSVADLVADYRAISGELAFSPGLPVKARWLARLLFGEAAAALDCRLHEALNSPARALLKSLNQGTGLPEIPLKPVLQGASVSLGRAVGRVRVILEADEGGKVQVGDIIVTNLSTPTYEGRPSIFPYRTVASVPIDRAGAIVTDEGGLLSHAAIVCRENSVPSLLGVETASETLEDGSIVEVDATRANGTLTVLD